MADLPTDFALNQSLSTFALAAMQLLDPESDTYALDVLSVLESTLDDPRPVLRAQEFRAKGEAVAQMKADGVDYEERMDRLAEVTWPKPLADLLEGAYEMYAQGHPWVIEHDLRPKSVARQMSELAMTFGEFVAHHKLASAEGVVLRYLSDAYKALRRTVPDDFRSPEVEDLTEWLGETVRQIDSSLLDEWEQLLHPDQGVLPRADQVDAGPPPVTANTRAFRVLVRNALFRRVEMAARQRWEDLGALDAEAGWHAPRWQQAMAGYFEEYEEIGIGAAARGPALWHVEVQPAKWLVRQVFDDPEGNHDWAISGEVDLAASDEAGSAVLRVVEVGPIGPTW